MLRRCFFAVLSAPTFATLSSCVCAQEVSEKDYFGDLPVVLSVSRLSQSLRDVPGSVTVLDRDTIRRSGARDMAEVLRLVPGFLFTMENGANPLAIYHSGMDVFGARMQVYVDGRSLYSSFLFGDTHLGLRGIVLDDVERIEVLRGSNSASYGANAFLGVVNITTRNAKDSHGVMLSATTGDNGLNDSAARVGWGDANASFRLTSSRRADSGFRQRGDDSQVSRIQFRADLTPTPADEVTIQLSAGEVSRGSGAGLAGNPFRTSGQGDVSLMGRWQHEIDPDQKLELRALHEREAFSDHALVTGTIAGIPVSAIQDSGGSVQRIELGVQHTVAWSAASRIAWGGEWRHEALNAPPLYFSIGSISLHQWRTYATFEWRPDDQWLLQASGMQEGHSYTGSAFSPRVAANFHLTPDHTVRAGISKSRRAPNFYELRADTRLYNLTPGSVVIPVGMQVPIAGWLYRSSGTVKPETLMTHELGYLGHIREANLQIDLRAFVERMNDRITVTGTTVANPAFPAFPYTNVKDFVNRPGPHLHGFEYQFDWRPLADTRLMISEMHIRSKIGAQADEALEAPFRSNSLAWFQKLPDGFDFTMISTAATPFKWGGGGDLINTPRRLDLRVAKGFSVGATRGELSVTTQAINGGSQIYKLTQRFDRRAFATLRLDF